MTTMTIPKRKFEDTPAVRAAVPLLIGLVGPSSAGKTFSALRLATGIQKVSGGEIFMIDTESRRGLHYADQFTFRHVPFDAPFSPLDYLAAIEHCVRKGATTIIIDSASHEHEGPGGVLEMHDAELQRMAGDDQAKAQRMTMAAWARPKAERRRLLNSILQMNVDFIWCFRAKEKLKVVPGKNPEQLGFQPIAGDDYTYEMMVNLLLLPGANGKPSWRSDWSGERAIMKLPTQFVHLFREGNQLDEATGEAMAKWAAGDAPRQNGATVANPLLARYRDCEDADSFAVLEEERRRLWSTISAAEKHVLKTAATEAGQRIAQGDEDFAPVAVEGNGKKVGDTKTAPPPATPPVPGENAPPEWVDAPTVETPPPTPHEVLQAVQDVTTLDFVDAHKFIGDFLGRSVTDVATLTPEECAKVAEAVKS